MSENVNKKNRVWIFGISVLFLIAAVLIAQARVERRYRASAAEHITLVVDSIDYRADLTRVYGKLVGRPHTSQRIDEIVLKCTDMTYGANDIDGVDFKRWFQWEDDGVIPIEIDFPKMNTLQSGVMIITTPRGVDTCHLTRN
ncbi:hypothetical protein [uncultured Muribaculum sp.]|jgi:hypothetical protein|uniref:hypothetical protein n=1 Tax=uncultured Muribaculum sp. TaxID=1918613 RepID=UPI0025B24DAE|nr:hypothetical protein [uncultured Muribaculum sp.]